MCRTCKVKFKFCKKFCAEYHVPWGMYVWSLRTLTYCTCCIWDKLCGRKVLQPEQNHQDRLFCHRLDIFSPSFFSLHVLGIFFPHQLFCLTMTTFQTQYKIKQFTVFILDQFCLIKNFLIKSKIFPRSSGVTIPPYVPVVKSCKMIWSILNYRLSAYWVLSLCNCNFL